MTLGLARYDMTIDGIRSRLYPTPNVRTVCNRLMFELREDSHGDGEDFCGVCGAFGGYTWRPGFPIVQFTSQGLEVS